MWPVVSLENPEVLVMMLMGRMLPGAVFSLTCAFCKGLLLVLMKLVLPGVPCSLT